MVKQGVLRDLDFSDFKTCVDCLKGKFPTRARNKGANRSKNILDFIHTNIFGSITLATLGGFRYFITFIDDYSIYGWIELLHEKFVSLNAFKAFKVAIELKTGKVIKCVN